MKEGKSAKIQSLPIRETNCIRIFVSLGGTANYCILFIRKIIGDILSNDILPHAALVAKEEHLVYLFLAVFLQFLLFSSEPDPELLQLFLLSLENRPKFPQLLQLVPLIFNILALGLYNLLFLSHPASLGLRHLPFFFFLLQHPFPFYDGFLSYSQLGLCPFKLGAKLFIIV